MNNGSKVSRDANANANANAKANGTEAAGADLELALRAHVAGNVDFGRTARALTTMDASNYCRAGHRGRYALRDAAAPHGRTFR